MDFLEAIVNETDGLLKRYANMKKLKSYSNNYFIFCFRRQGTLRKLLEAAKTNEIGLDKFMSENIAEVGFIFSNKEHLFCFKILIYKSLIKISDPEFLVYLDSEIENQDTNSPMENFLVTMKLRILDEIGK